MTISDAPFAEVVGRNLEGDFIAGCDTNEVLAHLARNMGENLVPVFKPNRIHRRGKNLHDCSVYFYSI